MELAPIVLFVFNRPFHTQQTVETLMNNALAEDSDLIIFSDSAKNQSAKEAVDEVRNYIKNICGFKSITIIERTENYGLRRNIEEGVTEIINKYGKIIVLEDDLITSPHFLSYMNDSLVKYEKCPEVYAITGYSHSNSYHPNDFFDDTYFLQLTSSWSWATWKNRWVFYKDSSTQLIINLDNDLKLKRLYNFDASYNYYSMLKQNIGGQINSWAIIWHSSVFKQKGLTLYPRQSLVANIGFDGSGTHYNKKKLFKDLQIKLIEDFQPKLTDYLFEKIEFRVKIASFLRRRFNLFNTLLHVYRSIKKLL